MDTTGWDEAYPERRVAIAAAAEVTGRMHGDEDDADPDPVAVAVEQWVLADALSDSALRLSFLRHHQQVVARRLNSKLRHELSKFATVPVVFAEDQRAATASSRSSRRSSSSSRGS